jgi:hypothetical protein
MADPKDKTKTGIAAVETLPRPAHIESAPVEVDDIGAFHPPCSTCACADFKGNEQIGVCRRNPPQHFMFIVPVQIQQAGMPPFEPKSWSQWPFVRRDNWCVDGYRALNTEGVFAPAKATH